MEVTTWRELLAFAGAAVASGLGLVRLLLAQQRALVERIISVLEASIQRQEAVNERAATALQSMSDGVRDNSRIMRRIEETLKITFDERRVR